MHIWPGANDSKIEIQSTEFRKCSTAIGPWKLSNPFILCHDSWAMDLINHSVREPPSQHCVTVDRYFIWTTKNDANHIWRYYSVVCNIMLVLNVFYLMIKFSKVDDTVYVVHILSIRLKWVFMHLIWFFCEPFHFLIWLRAGLVWWWCSYIIWWSRVGRNCSGLVMSF